MAKRSEIKFTVELDQKNIPERIVWEATDNPTGKPEETKSIALSVWDQEQRNTLRIDLWSKDMPVDEMKQFCIENVAGIAENIKNSTGDEEMHKELTECVQRLIKIVDSKAKGK